MKLRISELARDDLLEIWQYVASHNPEAAERLMQALGKLSRSCFGFQTSAESGTISPSVFARSPSASTSFYISLRAKF